MKTVADLCEALIRIPTVEPEPTGPAIALCAELLAPAGFRVTHAFETAPGIAHALLERDGDGPPLLIDAHLDTVPLGDLTRWTHNSRGEIRDGAVWGRGAVDDKGPLAAAVMALRDTTASRRLVLSLMGDEELHMRGVRAVLEHPTVRAATQVIALEPTDNAPIRAHKGNARVRVDVRGKAAHSSRPWEGVNALTEKWRLITTLEAWFAAGEGARRVAEFGDEPATLVVTRAHTPNEAYNVIPEQSSFWLNYRPLPGADDPYGDLLAAIRAAAATLGITTEAEVEFSNPPMLVPADSPLVRAVEAASGCAAASVPYGTHGGYFALGGRETVIFGPGTISQAHREDEHCPVGDLERGATLLAAIISALAS
jgi:acetylornithine deacetylase/succinyl-diaminopimelate desuccinylase-like protein